MKKILCFALFAFLNISSKAQSIPANENISLDQQLSNINKTSVTSGIIYERELPIANLYNFNKVATFNTANFNYFKQALSEMNKASNNTKFITLDAFKTLVSQNSIENEVDLSILNTQFHILNYNADNPSLGGLNFNTGTNKFTPIIGKVPFYMLHNTVIAPTKDAVTGTTLTYKVRNDLFFQNGTKRIKTLIANFGDGINRTLITNEILTNQNIVVSYNSSGEKVATFTITYSDNSTLTTYGKIYFNYVEPSNSLLPPSPICFAADPLKEDFELQATIPFKGYLASDPNIKAKINYRVFYHNNNGNTQKKIIKPIIIIDGFDPGDKRKFEDCDCAVIADCAVKNATGGFFDASKHRSMVDLMEYYDGDDRKIVIKDLRDKGYDVILVNHPKYEAINLDTGLPVIGGIDGGAYYIESNAMALVELLTQVNQKVLNNASTSKIAIVGPSMGGQISRYALAYMEKNNIPHNTYLWISVDSPHLGANIPMGDQALLNLVKESSDEAKDFYFKELSSPASQQQLIEFHREGVNYHYPNPLFLNAQTTLQGFLSNAGNPMFQTHYDKQINNGLPGSGGWPVSNTNFRKIAIVNGSLSGSRSAITNNNQPITPFANDFEKVLNLRGFQRVKIDLPIGNITFRAHIASLEANFMPSTGGVFQIARFKKFVTDRTTIAPNINNRGNMDNVPGGFFGAQSEISGSILGTAPVSGTNLWALNNWSTSTFSITNIMASISQRIGGSEWYLHEYNPIHSFIPSFSAIGHLNPNQNWNNPLNTNLTCSTDKQTLFDSYFGLSQNTQHTSFTKESVKWLLEELDGNPQAPYFPIQKDVISGPEFICQNTNITYSITDLCKVPSNVTSWSVTGNLAIVSQSGNSVVVTSTNAANTTGTVVATFQNGQKTEKTIVLGKPIVSNPLIVGSNLGYTQNGHAFAVTPVAGATSYNWTVATFSTTCAPNTGIPTSITNTGNSALFLWTNCPGIYIVTCAAVNDCGSTIIGSLTVTVVQRPSSGGGGGGCITSLEVNPNPVARTGTIALRIVPDPCGTPIEPNALRINTTNEAKIYDMQGNLRYSDTFSGDSFQINNVNLTRGNYVLNVITSSGVVIRKVIIMQ